MTAGRFASDLIEQWMDEVWAKEKWLALFSADPNGVPEPLAVEISGGNYSRQDPAWVRSAFNLITLDSAAVFSNLLPGTAVAAVGVMDASFNGALIGSALVPGSGPASYPTGGAMVIPAATFVLGMDVAAPAGVMW